MRAIARNTRCRAGKWAAELADCHAAPVVAVAMPGERRMAGH